MRKRTSSNIVENAIISIEGFEKVNNTLYQQVILKRQNSSPLENYILRIAFISLYLKCLLEQISDDELKEYKNTDS